MKTETKKYTVQVSLLDVCHPDYFRGCATSDTVEVLAVPVWVGMTAVELADGITHEFDYCSDTFHPDLDELSQCSIDFATDLLADGYNPFRYCATLEEMEEDESIESVYAYIKLEVVEA